MPTTNRPPARKLSTRALKEVAANIVHEAHDHIGAGRWSDAVGSLQTAVGEISRNTSNVVKFQASRAKKKGKGKAAKALYEQVGPGHSQSLLRGLAILECWGSKDDLLGIADIADRTDQSRSTTHRYVQTLVLGGYLVQGPGRKYRPVEVNTA